MLYPIEHQLYALLDPALSLHVKLPLSNFCYDIVLDVEHEVKGLTAMPLLWAWLWTIPGAFTAAKEALATQQAALASDAVGEGSVSMADQRAVRYALVCAQVVKHFFTHQGYQLVAGCHAGRPERLQEISSAQRALLAMSGGEAGGDATLSTALRNAGYHYAQTVPEAEWLEDLVVAHYEHLSELYAQQAETVFASLEALSRCSQRVQQEHRSMPALAEQAGEGGAVEVEGRANDETARFTEFREELVGHPGVCALVQQHRMGVLSALEQLPKRGDAVVRGENHTVEQARYEPWIARIVGHLRSQIATVAGGQGPEKRVPEPATVAAVWVMQLFRQMVEVKWGMSIEERDERGGKEEDELAGGVQALLLELGAIPLCLDLIAPGVQEELVLEAIRTLVALLYREGGHQETQAAINGYLASAGTELFFVLCKQWIAKITEDQCQLAETPDAAGAEEWEERALILRFLQLCSEGHYLANQDLTREQPANLDASINLLDCMVNHLAVLVRTFSAASTRSKQAMADLILEKIQGPCAGNQLHLAKCTKLVETANRMLRAPASAGSEQDEEDALKQTMLGILQGLLEGQSKDSQISRLLLEGVHVDVLFDLAVARGRALEEVEEGQLSELQTEALVVLQVMSSASPLVEKALGADRVAQVSRLLGQDDDGQACHGLPTVCSIEVVWDGVLQRRLFHVPAICVDLSEVSKSQLVEEVDRSSCEEKLTDFMARSWELYVEIQHQQQLRALGVDRVFSRQNQNNATWLGFFLACLISSLLLTYDSGACGDGAGEGQLDAYKLADAHDDVSVLDWQMYQCNQTVCSAALDPTLDSLVRGEHVMTCEASCGVKDCVYLDEGLADVVSVLSVCQVVCSTFVLLLNFAVRVPIGYSVRLSRDAAPLPAVAGALLEPLTLYYVVYQILTVAAASGTKWCTAFLLLDIVVKDTTTQNVVKAVYYPRKQLAMTMVLGLFVIYIFAIVNFYNFRDQFEELDQTCQTLWSCLQLHMGHGLRNGGGIGDLMTHTLGERFVFDSLFFVAVIIVLLNVIFGIIIDTFSELREQKIERLRDTYETCFVCGIDCADFNKASDSSVGGFTAHYRTEHNMWAYFYFLVHLWEQDKDDDDGLELFVRTKLQQKDPSWFPIGQAMGLGEEMDGGTQLDSLRAKLFSTWRNELAKLLAVERQRLLSVHEQSRLLSALDRASATLGDQEAE
eukprot:gene22814-27564_t